MCLLTTGSENGTRILESIFPDVEEERQMSKGADLPPADNIRYIMTLPLIFASGNRSTHTCFLTGLFMRSRRCF